MEILEKIYKKEWLINYIHKKSDELLKVVTDPTKFEERCMKNIIRYLRNIEGKTPANGYLRYIVDNNVKEALDGKNSRMEEADKLTDIKVTNEKGVELEDEEFEPIDVLANVEDKVLSKEKVTLLAQGDGRNSLILSHWMSGVTNTVFISESLARSLGGKPESHRRYITRFRESCRETLTTSNLVTA